VAFQRLAAQAGVGGLQVFLADLVQHAQAGTEHAAEKEARHDMLGGVLGLAVGVSTDDADDVVDLVGVVAAAVFGGVLGILLGVGDDPEGHVGCSVVAGVFPYGLKPGRSKDRRA
jgi:hypothetical protein